MSDRVIELLWTQLWQITLLIPVAILTVRTLTKHASHFSYAILLLILIKTVTPPLWSSPTGVFSWVTASRQTTASTSPESPSPTPATPAAETPFTEKLSEDPESALAVSAPETASTGMVDDLASIAESDDVLPSQKSSQISWVQISLFVWFTGAISLIGYLLGKLGQMRRFHQDTRVEPSDDLLEAVEIVSANLGLTKIPRVLVTLHPSVPFATGVFRPFVVLPSHLVDKTTPEEMRLILAHEMTHLRRGDTIVGVLQLMIQTIWWFHPFVWWLNREMRRVREECCDRDVVTQLQCRPASYARCLINMLELHQKLRHQPGLAGLSPLEVTRQRLQKIMQTQAEEPRNHGRLRISVLTILLALVILPGAPIQARSAAVSGEIAAVSEENIPTSQQQESSRSTENEENSEEPLTPSDVSPSEVQQSRNSQPSRERDLELNYAWKRGDVHRYSLELTAEYPTQIHTHSGTIAYQVDAVAAGRPALSLLETSLNKNSVAREGVSLPRISSPVEPSDPTIPPFSSMRPPFSRGPFSYQDSIDPETVEFGSDQFRDPESGVLPYLLGNLETWVFPPVPGNVGHTWTDHQTRKVRLVASSSGSVGRGSPFDSQPEMEMLLQLTRRETVSSWDSEKIGTSTDWHLQSNDQVDGSPRREIHLLGRTTFNRQTSFVLSGQYEGQLIERERFHEYRIPLKIQVVRSENHEDER
ncbi:Regulatory protein BlaR1 [Thalassoglobus neptunius]|uniref:Regulatory protein BlaR1 n=1 Tax=Thalassoglobus neptunius TaxID=1938619 RepID=A0A5C5X1R3_9PLAN|nr:M56 family metallopeptidase [Thalassoglobus neptunius]TWT56856.1 Regulatory protein BlaR1 [Thalassoglobus neptunius]